MVKSLASAVVACVLAVAFAAPAGAASAPKNPAPKDPAAKQIESFYTALVGTMKQGKKLGVEGRYKALKPAIEATFDLPVMTRFAVGPAWEKMTDAQHKELVAAFERMTIANYAKNFDSYNGQAFVVLPDIISRPPDKLVQTEMRPVSGDAVKFNYRMRKADNGQWQVIDVLLAGFTSQLALRRSEFAHTVDTEGAAGLVKKINKVADNTMKG